MSDDNSKSLSDEEKPDASSEQLSQPPIPDTLNDQLPPQKPKSNMPLIGGGVGCVLLLLCLGLLGGSGLIFYFSNASEAESSTSGSDGVSSEVVLQENDETEVVPKEIETSESEAVSSTAVDELTESQETGSETSDSSTAANFTTLTPEFGDITFSLDTTATGDPVEPGFLFEAGITTLHAAFDYANLTPNHRWTQVWYHNGNEISSTSQPWLEGKSGLFDYVIEAGGEPLATGEWTLEFYLDDELLTAGSFVIENPDEILETSEADDSIDIAKVYKLAYTKWNGEKHDLFIGDTNGNNERFIMSRAAGPSWSPNGRYLFFFGEEGVDQQYVNGVMYPLAGVATGIARVTVVPPPANVEQIEIFQGRGWNDGTGRWASVSPDGKMVTYDGDRGGGRRLYFLGSDANQQFRFEIIGEQADWSPDSRKVTYRSGRDNKTGIWISNRDDTGHTPITIGGADSFPTWSADGKTIAFSRDEGGNVDIYTVNVNGGNLTRLTTASGHDTLPVFLPNGDLVFRSARTGGWAIWKMKGDGSEQTMIIADAPVGPEWSGSKMDVLR